MSRPIDYSKWDNLDTGSSSEEDAPVKRPAAKPAAPLPSTPVQPRQQPSVSQTPPTARQSPGSQAQHGASSSTPSRPQTSPSVAQARMLKQYQDLYRDMEELHERVKRKKGSPEFAVAEELCRQFKSVAGNKLPTTYNQEIHHKYYGSVKQLLILMRAEDEKAALVAAFGSARDAAARAERLLDAIRSGDCSTIRALFASNEGLRAGLCDGTGMGRTLVHSAAEQDKPAVVETLLSLIGSEEEKRALLTTGDCFQDTPLISASRGRSAGSARALLAAGANPSDKNMTGSTAAHIACLEGALDVLKVLCDGGADMNAGTGVNDLTPLAFAVKGKFLGRPWAECVDYILRGPRGAETDMSVRAQYSDFPGSGHSPPASWVTGPRFVTSARPHSPRVRQIVVEEAARREAARPGSGDPDNVLGLRPGPRGSPDGPGNPLQDMMRMMMGGMGGGAGMDPEFSSFMSMMGGGGGMRGGYVPESDGAARPKPAAGALPRCGHVVRFAAGACVADPQNLAPSEHIKPSAAWSAAVSPDPALSAAASPAAKALLAFLGARHPRLGADSPARDLPKPAVMAIARHLKPRPRASCVGVCGAVMERAARRPPRGGAPPPRPPPCPCAAKGIPCFDDCPSDCCKANPLNKRLPRTDCARDHSTVVLGLSPAQLAARYPLACRERWGDAMTQHSVDGKSSIPLSVAARPGARDFSDCEGCGNDGPQHFSFCLNRLVNSDRVMHCLSCGRCFYFRSGFPGSCPYCLDPDPGRTDSEEEKAERERLSKSNVGKEAPEEDEMEMGLAMEGYWGF